MSTATLAPAAGRTKRALADVSGRLSGLCAIGFTVIVVIQNLIRGGSAPAADASASEVLAHYAGHRTATFLLVATFVVGGAALATFVGGAMRRFLAGNRPGWAIVGGLGAVGVTAMFSIVVAAEQALSVVAMGAQPDLGTVQALWTFHNSAFSVLHLSLAIALLGLSRAGVGAGLTPKAFEVIAPVGAGLLAVGAMAGPAIAAGDAMPILGLAFAGFAVWLAFLVSTGLRLVRGA